MSEKKEGIIVILSSPSGAGKTTLVKKISTEKNYSISISHTTRKPRSYEIDGNHYFFVSNSEFLQLIQNEKFLEYAKVFNNYYGSSKKNVIENLKAGKNVIFDIDWQGTRQIRNKKLNFKLFTIYILPPSKKELINRLIKREKKNMKTVKKRMKEFKKDLSKWKEYDYVVINDDLKKCYQKIMYVIKNKNKIKFNRNFIQEHVKNLLT